VRVTQEDIDKYGGLSGDPELIVEHVIDDPEANHHISGLVPHVSAGAEAETGADPRPAARTRRPRRKARRVQRGGGRSWLDILLGR